MEDFVVMNFKKIVAGSLVAAGVMGAMGVELYTTQAQATNANVDVFLSNLTPTATSCQTFLKNQDSSGAQLALLQNGQEVSYDNALLTIPANNSYASLYFVDVQENGYLRFQADVGLHSAVRSKGGQVEFKVFADGQQVYSSGTVTNETQAQSVDVDLSGVEVLQLVVDAKGSNANDQAVWGNARFTTAGNTPYLAVDDLEFNQSWQVTPENILEYVSAKDVGGNDITNSVTYETDYQGQDSGTFSVTYTATDSVGNTHSRTVDLVVTGEDYTGELTVDRLRKPWASYLYHGRGTLGSQGKKAWDLILSQVLDFQPEKWKLINRWGEDVYEVNVNLQDYNIFTTKAEMNALGTMFMDDEPRTFHLKDWGCDVYTKDGLASNVVMWVKKSQADQYDAMLTKIEGNTQMMLAKYKPDMTEAQGLYYVSNAYKSWLKYGNNGQLLSDSLGNGTAVCGGNARGYIYLSQRLGSKSVWGRSGSHAWSFTKLVDVKEWFKTDLLSGEFLAPGVNGEGNLSVGGSYKPRHYKWFVFGTQQYDKNLLRYPSVWVELNQSEVLLPDGQDYNLYDYVSSFGSIFNQNLAKETIEITVDKVNEAGEVIRENIGFPVSGSSSDLAAGYYRVTYDIADSGKTNTASLTIRVTGEPAVSMTFGDRTSSTGSSGPQATLGLWDGTAEKWYSNGIYINEGGSVTYNVEGKHYKYLTYDFGIKNSVRANTAYGSYGKVATKVEITTPAGTQTVYQGNTLGWYTKYEHVALQLPEDTISVTIYAEKKGGGNNHAGIGGLTFFQDSGLVENVTEENPPALTTTTLEIYDNQTFDAYTALKGQDSEDGYFTLTPDNFTVEQLEQVDGKYVSGTHELKYTLTDSHGNVTTGVLTIHVVDTQVVDVSEYLTYAAQVKDLVSADQLLTASTRQKLTAAITALENAARAEKPHREALDAQRVALENMVNGLYTISVDGVAKVKGLYGELYTLQVSAAKDSSKFMGWTVDDKIVSTKENYTFAITGTANYVATFVEESEAVVELPSADIASTIGTKRTDGKMDAKFVSQLTVPQGYKMLEVGLLWASSEGGALCTDDGPAAGAKKTTVSKVNNNYQYSVTINGLPKGRFVRGVSYAKLQAPDGTVEWVYSDEGRISNPS